jgi:urease accessory protein
MQLADSALPIGSAAHSFGLEALVAEDFLQAGCAPEFLRDYLKEAGLLEAVYCRAGRANGSDTRRWVALNRRLSACKLAGESRAASATLGRRLLRLLFEMEKDPLLDFALQAEVDIHYCTAFGLAGSAIGVEEDLTVAAYLHQSLNGLISACQRLMPLGQSRAAAILWDLKPALIDIVRRSAAFTPDSVCAFTPMVELASMRHATLATRLFIS